MFELMGLVLQSFYFLLSVRPHKGVQVEVIAEEEVEVCGEDEEDCGGAGQEVEGVHWSCHGILSEFVWKRDTMRSTTCLPALLESEVLSVTKPSGMWRGKTPCCCQLHLTIILRTLASTFLGCTMSTLEFVAHFVPVGGYLSLIHI